jgi:hypothetical protein
MTSELRISSINEPTTCCHVLDTGSIWLKEFASALGTMVPTCNWWPEMRGLGHWEDWEKTEVSADPSLTMIRFPLQRGYARFPIPQLFPFETAITERLKRRVPRPDRSILICTTPFYAPVAERWPGRVVYYLTDLTKEYASANGAHVVALDRKMCRVAHAVCPNSFRIADYLQREAGCNPEKITVVPNATRAENILEEPLLEAGPLPHDLADLPRPIIGVMGNLASNMDWLLMREAIKGAEDVSWVFVGPSHERIRDTNQQRARGELVRRGGRIRFVGPKSYGRLCHYARAFDVALMPYRKQEPTYSGSATRFYEHLAACRPILSSRGFHELLTKEPLLKLVDDGEGIVSEVNRLRNNDFRDGFEELRWLASRNGTWLVRARDLLAAAAGSNSTDATSLQEPNQRRACFLQP